MTPVLYATQVVDLPSGPYLRKPVVMGLAPHLTPEQPAGIRVRVLNSLAGPMRLVALHWAAKATTHGCELVTDEGSHNFDDVILPIGSKFDYTIPNAIVQRATDTVPTAVKIVVTAEAQEYVPELEVSIG